MLPRYPNRPVVNYEWCHGPTGTARLFLALDDIDARRAWRTAADTCLQAIRAARVPTRRHPGFWDNLACCCGTAGVGRLLPPEAGFMQGTPGIASWLARLAALAAGQRPSGGTPTRSNRTRKSAPR